MFELLDFEETREESYGETKLESYGAIKLESNEQTREQSYGGTSGDIDIKIIAKNRTAYLQSDTMTDVQGLFAALFKV